MFDNLRDEAHSFQAEEEAKFLSAAGTISGPIAGKSGRFLGMTAIQRFVITFLLMAAVCVLGAMCLLVTGKLAF